MEHAREHARQRGLLPQDLYRITYVDDPQISPDGGRVAFVRTWLEREGDAYRSQIWLVPASGGEPRRLSAGGGRDTQPRWSPDGRWLAFLSDRDPSGPKTDGQKGKAQIWRLPLSGGEATRLTNLPENVERFAWSPDGARIAFAARVADERPGAPTGSAPSGGNGASAQQSGQPSGDARIITSLRYKSNGDGFIHDRRRHIFVVEAGSGVVRQLTHGDFDDADPAWSPDGTTIAFSSARHARHELDSAADIFVISAMVSADGGEPRRLTATLGPAQTPAFRPDGNQIAYLGHDDPHAGGARNTGVWAVPARDASTAEASAPARPRCLTSAFDRTVLSDAPPRWLADGTIWSLFADSGTAGLAAVDDHGGAPQTLLGGNRALSAWSTDTDARRIAFCASTPASPAELFVVERDDVPAAGNSSPPTVRERRLTSFNDAWLAEVELPQPQSFRFASVDGTEVEGWLLRPGGFDPSRAYPLLLNVHGGPHMYYGWSFFDEVQVQAGAGYAVLYLNPRGSQGYGEDFAGACRQDWGGKDFEDVMAGLDHALAQFPFLDPERLGVLGGSYGGFMTSWVVGHTTRFRAAVSERAVNSLVSLFGTSDIGYWFLPAEIGRTPADALAFYVERSPITYADRVETPLLIMHSENDLRCPMEQAEQFFVAVRLHGRADVTLVRFPEENHELSRSGKPSRRVERFEIILDWFDRYLRPAEGSAPRSAKLAAALRSGAMQRAE